jgi:tRNA threonylcarbamoyl adenosine modification protein (Sua5/YciO/YrdC/YwlC family)
MKILENRAGVDSRAINAAIDALRDGQIIIYPTDTLYALGCDALNNRAIERLCKIKGINPEKNTLAIVCGSLSQAAEYARIDNNAFRLLKHYLPGAFTFILPASSALPKIFKGRKTVGIRIPDNEIDTALASELGNPIMTTSIPFTKDTADPWSIAELYKNNGDIALCIDGGDANDTPSTIIDTTDSSTPKIIRQGLGIFED